MNPSRNETVKTRGTHPILRHLDYTPKGETTGGVVDETPPNKQNAAVCRVFQNFGMAIS